MKSVKVIGLPYEGPENFQPGVQLAPAHIRWAYDSIEWYSIYQNSKVPEFEDVGDFYFYSKENPEIFPEKAKALLKKHEILPPFLVLGGDHSITLPVVAHLKENGQKFKVIHLDAHLDRRNSMTGNPFSHASVIRRIEELIGIDNVYTFGYRSYFPEEIPNNATPFKVLEPLENFLKNEQGPFYLTLDLDVLDPSVLPAVSNPEPGGISFFELLECIKLLKGKVIAADIVELDPLLDHTRHSSIIAAEIFREILIILSTS
ncbi:MAG: arginase family protein [candidate division WOR-3 bacterium]